MLKLSSTFVKGVYTKWAIATKYTSNPILFPRNLKPKPYFTHNDYDNKLHNSDIRKMYVENYYY